ncbi:MAG: alpha/beta hydrolase [Planctomycetota bacterium]
MNPQFFGKPDQPLFGVYHRALGATDQRDRAVVICPPIGHEYVRTHWCLRSLAGQIARKGIHVFRFDYFGLGDSSGSVDEIKTKQSWIADIHQAKEQLRKLSGADSVMLLGLRAGGLFAAEAAAMSNVHSLLLWEPIWDGSLFLQQWRELHQEMLYRRSAKMVTENGEHHEEILGSLYCRGLLSEMDTWFIDWDQIQPPHFIFDLKKHTKKYSKINHPLRKTEFYQEEDSWTDLQQMETAWLRPKLSRRLVAQVVDTFERLKKFGLLDPQPSNLQGAM